MNRLTKSRSRQGRGTRSPSVRGHVTPVSAADTSATRSPAATSAATTGAAVPVGTPSCGATPIGGWWPTLSPSEGLYPQGGFSIFLQSYPYANHPNGNENFHFVGVGMSQSTVPPIDLAATRTPSPTQQTHDIVDNLDAQEDETINVDDDSRTDKRLNWQVPEDIRLASAWLRCSKDPIDGNDKKSDAYWADVTNEYNKIAESSRKRNKNQLKIRWDRSKKPLSDFHGVWVNASRVWQSGMSDDQLTDKALEMWAGQNNGKAFHLQHMWKVLRGEQKWSAYLARLKKEQEKSVKSNGAHLVNLELDGEKRPVGHKKAKKEQNGKKKADALADFSDRFEKYIEETSKSKEDREKIAEIQQSLADKRIEAARLNRRELTTKNFL